MRGGPSGRFGMARFGASELSSFHSEMSKLGVVGFALDRAELDELAAS